MSNFFQKSILILICFVIIGSIAMPGYAMYHDVTYEVKRGTLLALREYDEELEKKRINERINEKRKEEWNRLMGEFSKEREKVSSFVWDYILEIDGNNCGRPLKELSFEYLTHLEFLENRVNKLKDFNKLSSDKKNKIIAEAQEKLREREEKNQKERKESEARKEQKKVREEALKDQKKRWSAVKMEHEALLQKKHMCNGCKCGDKGCLSDLGCTFLGCLCLPTLGFCCTTSWKDCWEGYFCNDSICFTLHKCKDDWCPTEDRRKIIADVRAERVKNGLKIDDLQGLL